MLLSSALQEYLGALEKAIHSMDETYDVLIAATALSKNGILVTHNVKEFTRVEGLKIEDWH